MTEETPSGQAPTSPRGPAPTRRAQPLTLTSSPGPVHVAVVEHEVAQLVAARLTLPATRAPPGRVLRQHRHVGALASDENAACFGGKRQRGKARVAGGRGRRRLPLLRAPERDRDSRQRPSVGERRSPGDERLVVGECVRPIRVDWTQTRTACCHSLARTVAALELPSRRTGSTTSTAWPRPPGSAAARSIRVSVSVSGTPWTRTVVESTRRPGGAAALSRHPSCRYFWNAGQSSGPTAYACTRRASWFTE